MKWGAVWSGVQFARIGVTSKVLGTFDRDRGKRYLIEELSRIPGLSGKFGQLLALKFGQGASLDSSRSAPHPMPIEWIKQKIESTAPLLAAQILEIDSQAQVASIGQVHRARLKDGRQIAIKVRYEGVAESLNHQLDILLASFDQMPLFIRRNLRTEDYRQFLREFFNDELDYRKEADSQMRFREGWKHDPKVIVPMVFKEFSTDEILVQSFEPSVSLSELSLVDAETRLNCRKRITDFFLAGVFEHGWVHTDLHPKNWGYRKESDELVVYDFGATLKLDETLLSTLRTLAFEPSPSVIDCLLHFEALGFDPAALIEIQDRLPDLTEIIFRPMRRARASGAGYDFRGWNPGEELEKLLGEKKWVFRSAGAPWFLMLIRSFGGWFHALQRLGEPFDLPNSEWAGAPNRLFVSITQNGKFLVDLEFPATTVHSLEDLLPEGVATDLAKNGIDLGIIKAQAIESGLAPQLLFESTRADKTYRVRIDR